MDKQFIILPTPSDCNTVEAVATLLRKQLAGLGIRGIVAVGADSPGDDATWSIGMTMEEDDIDDDFDSNRFIRVLKTAVLGQAQSVEIRNQSF